MKFRFLMLAASAALLGACASAPQPLQGTFAPITAREAVVGAQVGSQVRWGGRIIQTTPGPQQTCFQLVSRPLGSTGRPLSSSPDADDGRFVACRDGFYDPAVFAPGREVTFAGTIDGYESTRIGEYDYKLPRLAANVVYLWPEVREVDVIASPFYDPFWGPGPYWGPGWGWGYRGGWW
ncbi:Slp family lipoprotein [Pseudoxanthomonas dokdonensis]|uniref:Membrane protein n=1 Tax=Pseudoxanthomonas dokdonensis TaxID=344882 RepID=A0A0R0CXP8_9GAMM|nr:Slp family lipoprotein [Pseudoxanthomonas dokdonensis]KRG70846.1 membrane protein [Pseudoxanthomonas dokdonensis]